MIVGYIKQLNIGKRARDLIYCGTKLFRFDDVESVQIKYP